MGIYCVHLRGTPVALIRKVFLMLYHIWLQHLRSRSLANFICVLSPWLCYLIRTGNTHISPPETFPPPKNLCAEGCKGSGRESLRYNLGGAKGKEREEGERGRKGEGGGPGCELTPRTWFKKA